MSIGPAKSSSRSFINPKNKNKKVESILFQKCASTTQESGLCHPISENVIARLVSTREKTCG